jgi:DNA gyrase subunit A
MAKRVEQLDFLEPEPSQGKVIPIALHAEMQRSYLEYAMSVIVGRALPDARDGLKPVHRRVLFAMHELGLLPDRPYRKCARVVGDVLGKYHPHGDQSVYDALVRLVQDFSSRYPILAGHGNFGSVDNDPAAAMRYTECRLSELGNDALLQDINESVIDFTDNFDGSQQEPVVLPSQLPMLLLNGASGIAVGMATNIPPHNLNEVVDGAIALIDRPDLPDEKLFELIPAPDFPTGGIIVDDAGIKEAYSTGRGSITIRGIVAYELIETGRTTGKNRRPRPALVVTELPFQVNKAAWIEKIAELVNNNKLDGISDIRDESDRTGMRVVIEIKKDYSPELLLENLYRQTALQSNFGTIMLALVGAQPKQMSLRELLQQFLDFREETLTRSYRHELGKATSRSHLVEGLLSVVTNLGRLIEILHQSSDGPAAKIAIQSQLNLSELQADAVLSMPLRRLTGMEQQNLRDEMTELQQQITQLELLLGDRRELLKAMKKELRHLKKKHGDARRTRIGWRDTPPPLLTTELPEPNGEHKVKRSRGTRGTNGNDTNGNGTEDRHTTDSASASGKSAPSKNNSTANDTKKITRSLPPLSQTPVEDTILQITYKGYIKRLEASNSNGHSSPIPPANDDITIAVYPTRTDHELLTFTSSGRVFPLEVANIPPLAKGSKSKGTPLITFLNDPTDKIVAHRIWERNPETTDSLVLLSAQAKIKRSPLAEYAAINARGLSVMKLKDDDQLFWAGTVRVNQQIAIATSTGRILRMPADEEQIPMLGRAAMGDQALRLRQTETLVAAIALDLGENPDTEIVLITAQGMAKRIGADNLRLAPRGSIGSQTMTFRNKQDYLVAAAAIAPQHTQITLLVGRSSEDQQPRILQIPITELPLQPCNSPGQSIVELSSTEKIMHLELS